MPKLVSVHTAAAVVVVVALLATLQPLRLSMAVYPWLRQAAQAKTSYEIRHYDAYETEHFTVRYHNGDTAMAALVAQAAEAAYQPVSAMFNYNIAHKTVIVMAADQAELNRSFGWSGDQHAMGVYWGGSIQVLSPRSWPEGSVTIDEFMHSGPMVHEFTHLVFDYMVNGNYPRWFTEGLAQYAEYQVNGYQWLTATNNLQYGHIYSLAELQQQFDELPNQSLAYRQSFAAVQYISVVHGEAVLQQVIKALATGRTMEEAITATLAMSYERFEHDYLAWARSSLSES